MRPSNCAIAVVANPMSNSASAGDLLVITKKIGTGVLTTAAKVDLLTEEENAEIEATVGDEIEHGAIFGDANRVVERQDRYVRPHAHLLGARRDRGRRDHRRRHVIVVGEVMLEYVRGAETQGFRPGEKVDGLGVYLR